MIQYTVAFGWGVSGSLAWAGTVKTYVFHGTTTGDDTSVFEYRDGYGEILGQGIYDKKKRCTVEVSVKSTSKSAVQAMITIPTGSLKVTIAGSDNTDLNGDWVYQTGGAMRESNADLTIFTLPLVQFTNLTATQLTTVVS